MTNQEAVEVLIDMSCAGFLLAHDKGSEAVHLAINALKNQPSEKAFTRAELEAWLYEIALNNCGNSLERACVELISRLDGFERFVEDKRKEGQV